MQAERRDKKFASWTLTVLGVFLLPSVFAESDSERTLRAAPSYRIIYNWDGAPHGYSPYPQTLEQFLEKTFAPLKDTQVGALFWCIGEHEATWLSKNLPITGDSEDRTYRSVRSMVHNENIRAMLARGENPYQAMVERGKQLGIDVYLSIRMNDNHFEGLQLEEMPTTKKTGLTEFRRAHPEWCLGAERAPKWFALSWNMAIPEVRERRFQYIKEAIEQADWAGVELDWQRHAFHLPADDAWRLRYTLTDLQRAVRRLTSSIARNRKRPFYVAVRVATTMDACRRIGYDLGTWVEDRLCDVMIAGGGAGTDPGVEVEAFRALLKGSGIAFYPGFDGGFWGERQGLEPSADWTSASFRGYSKAYWERGANGIYVFNWHANEKTRRALLTTVGDVATLAATDKVFPALHRLVRGPGQNWSGADLNDRLHGETPVTLYRTLSGEGPRFSVPVYDHVEEEAKSGRLKTVELRVELGQHSTRDRIEISLDGRQLEPPDVRTVVGEDPLDPGEVSDNSWLVWSLRPEAAAMGEHTVRIRLLERDPRLRPPVVVERVEIHVDYR